MHNSELDLLQPFRLELLEAATEVSPRFRQQR